jgi:hypothetical protein
MESGMGSPRQIFVPVASFVLAVVLAMVGGPARGAMARKFADPTGGVDECRSDVKNGRGFARVRNFRIDTDHPAQSTGKVRTRTVVDFWGGIVTGGAPAKSDDVVIFASEMHFFLSGTHADGSDATETLTMSLTPIDGFGREQFELNGLKWKRNLESQFYESADDLARLLRTVIRVRQTQGDTVSYDSSQIFDFVQVTASETHRSPLANNEWPCATDLMRLPLVIQAIEGYGRTSGILDD